jgi:hypothetical protein
MSSRHHIGLKTEGAHLHLGTRLGVQAKIVGRYYVWQVSQRLITTSWRYHWVWRIPPTKAGMKFKFNPHLRYQVATQQD